MIKRLLMIIKIYFNAPQYFKNHEIKEIFYLAKRLTSSKFRKSKVYIDKYFLYPTYFYNEPYSTIVKCITKQEPGSFIDGDIEYIIFEGADRFYTQTGKIEVELWEEM